jgi:hypothetical protein
VAFVIAFPLAGAAPARAQSGETKAAAERLYNDGLTLMDRRDYEGACAKFAESLRLDTGVGVTLRLADCYEKLGKVASAWGTFREAADLATKQGDTRRVEVARRHAAALEPQLSTLTLTVAVEEQGLVIQRDGVVVGRAQWGLAIPVDPGPHTVTAVAPGRKRWESTTHVPGAHASVTLTVPDLEEEASTPAPPAPTEATAAPAPVEVSAVPPADATTPPRVLGTQRLAAIGVGGLGVVGLGVGALFGLKANASLGDSNANGNCLGDHCNAAGTQARNDALGAATVSTIAFVVGGAAIVGGVVLWLTAPQPEGARVGVTGATMTGRDASVVVGGSF